ncbi:DMT family transporter [Stenomitos frigidus]|uniref:EamA family transporter n=1 Tax=Stenomitos frigidus ULC18 TaxID=2107698 RepID=A0A2T1E7F3_9CYAN|nr:DMT family transporter [Stenomitos frigidus]PSB28615.1 EamA family transporter [Stenomitos frigidus ULC18]
MTQSSFQASLPGVGFGVGTALLFGGLTPLTKLFLDDVQPWMLAGLLFLGGGLGLLPIALIRNQLIRHRKHPPSDRLQKHDWRWLGASIVVGGVIAPVLLTLGLVHTTAASASLLLNFECVFTALLAWTIFGERWRWQVFVGMLAIVAGGVVLSQGEKAGVGLTWGALLILGTCFHWALDSNFTTKIAMKDPVQVAMLKSGVAGAINVAIALLIGQPLPPLPILCNVLVIGFLTSGLTLFCFVMALRHLGASRAGAYFALSPFAGAAVSALLLKEGLNESLVFAAILMAAGAGLCARIAD